MLTLDVLWAERGTCSLMGKEDAPGFVVTFKDGTVREGFLCDKALIQLLRMKAPQRPERPASKEEQNASS